MSAKHREFRKWLMGTVAYPRRVFGWLWSPHPVVLSHTPTSLQ